MRKELVLFSAIAALFTFTMAFDAGAAPITAAKGVSTAGDQVTKVAQGCGRYWHRNRWGRCVPNGYRRYWY